MTGFVMTEKDASYADMTQAGRIVIERDANGEVRCAVSGFKFESAASCREHTTRAMAWGRDVLEAAIQADMLVPGGRILSVVD